MICCVIVVKVAHWKHIHIHVQGSPSGCVWREIPGVTQIDEKGHEGNTSVVTAYLCWRKHGQRNSRTGVPAHYYYLLWTLYHTHTAILLSTIVYFEHYYTRTAVGRRWRPNHRVVTSSTHDRAWEETILTKSCILYIIALKVVACPASRCRGNTFPSPSNVWRHWRHSRC